MSIVLMTGSHPRHAFIAQAVARSGMLAGLVIEEREDHVPQPPEGLDDTLRVLFVRHFAERAKAEERAFGTSVVLPSVETCRVALAELNGPRVWDFLDRLKPRLLLSYGVHKLVPETLNRVAGLRWNIHGGLSPWYRGVITHFWPSYMLEPQMTGMTVHETTEAIDGGAVIHQNVAALVRGDGVHDLACRAVAGLAEELPELVRRTMSDQLKPPVVQRTTGRIWRGEDWRPAHLRLVYDFYANRIVDHYLDGAFGTKAPRLVRQL